MPQLPEIPSRIPEEHYAAIRTLRDLGWSREALARALRVSLPTVDRRLADLRRLAEHLPARRTSA